MVWDMLVKLSLMDTTNTAYSKIRKFRHHDMSEATVTMKIFEDEDHGLHAVWRYLPPGMDIAPDCWRFSKQGFAERRFNEVCAELESKGFTCVQEARL